MNPVPIAPAEKRSVELVAMATGLSALSWPLSRLSLPGVPLQSRVSERMRRCDGGLAVYSCWQ